MRPTDENQHGSTRPNLLSGTRRRPAEDDNLLARLERDSARQATGNRSRAAWQAVAAALLLLLVLFVAWIAFDNARAPQVVPMKPVPSGQAPVSAAFDAVPEPAPTRTGSSGNTSTLPPLVLLQQPAPAPAKPAAPPAPAPTIAAQPADRPKAAARARPPAPPAVALARTIPRARKGAVETVARETPIDTDVALLSAIIIHDSAHAVEKAQLEAAATCARTSEKRCARRVPGHLDK